MENISKPVELPPEMMKEILLRLPDLKKYVVEVKSKYLYYLAKDMFNHYIQAFNKIDKNWRWNLKKLTKTIFLELHKECMKGESNENYNTKKRSSSSEEKCEEYKNQINFLKYHVERTKGCIIYYAAYYNCTDFLVNVNVYNYWEVFKGASKGGHSKLIEYFISELFREDIDLKTKFTYFDVISKYAAKGGHLDIVKYAVEKVLEIMKKLLLTQQKMII